MTCILVFMCILCITVQGVEYFLIKWKGWANAFNSWEPRSNLGCEDLIGEFERSNRKRTWKFDVAAATDPETKRQKIKELVDQLYVLDPQLTALRFIELYEQLDASKVG